VRRRVLQRSPAGAAPVRIQAETRREKSRRRRKEPEKGASPAKKKSLKFDFAAPITFLEAAGIP
jgi:hypothetical protein